MSKDPEIPGTILRGPPSWGELSPEQKAGIEDLNRKKDEAIEEANQIRQSLQRILKQVSPQDVFRGLDGASVEAAKRRFSERLENALKALMQGAQVVKTSPAVFEMDRWGKIYTAFFSFKAQVFREMGVGSANELEPPTRENLSLALRHLSNQEESVQRSVESKVALRLGFSGEDYESLKAFIDRFEQREIKENPLPLPPQE